MTLPRLVTLSAQFNFLEFAPLPELKQLRQSPPLFEAKPASALANFSAGGTAAKPSPASGRQLNVVCAFAATVGSRFGLCLSLPPAPGAACVPGAGAALRAVGH